MCVIIELPKGFTIPFTELQNAVWNNPHGYGLVVVKNKGELEVIKEIDVEGTKPETIRDLLDKHKDYHRFLHLRWRTEGSVTEDNLHPFIVYDDGTNQVYFMHNGTLHDFKPAQGDLRSDSHIFALEILVPLLAQFNGNYQNDFVKKVITKFWGFTSGSRGLLLSNSHVPTFINLTDWKEIVIKTSGDDVKFRASNDTYFDKLIRGFEFDRREAERKAAQAVLPFHPSTGTKEWPVVALKDIDLRPNETISKELEDLFADLDLYSEVGTAALANLTSVEIEKIVNDHPDVLIGLLVHVTSMYHDLLRDKLTSEEKLERATKMIATLKGRAM